MRRQYCLWIKVGLGLCSHGHRNPPGSCQEPCSSPNPWHAVGWMLTTGTLPAPATPQVTTQPGHAALSSSMRDFIQAGQCHFQSSADTQLHHTNMNSISKSKENGDV